MGPALTTHCKNITVGRLSNKNVILVKLNRETICIIHLISSHGCCSQIEVNHLVRRNAERGISRVCSDRYGHQWIHTGKRQHAIVHVEVVIDDGLLGEICLKICKISGISQNGRRVGRDCIIVERHERSVGESDSHIDCVQGRISRCNFGR